MNAETTWISSLCLLFLLALSCSVIIAGVFGSFGGLVLIILHFGHTTHASLSATNQINKSIKAPTTAASTLTRNRGKAMLCWFTHITSIETELKKYRCTLKSLTQTCYSIKQMRNAFLASMLLISWLYLFFLKHIKYKDKRINIEQFELQMALCIFFKNYVNSLNTLI